LKIAVCFAKDGVDCEAAVRRMTEAMRLVNLRPSRLLSQVAAGLATGGAFAAICLAVRWLGFETTWPMFWDHVVLALILYVPVALLILVERRDRQRLFQKLRFRVVREV